MNHNCCCCNKTTTCTNYYNYHGLKPAGQIYLPASNIGTFYVTDSLANTSYVRVRSIHNTLESARKAVGTGYILSEPGDNIPPGIEFEIIAYQGNSPTVLYSKEMDYISIFLGRLNKIIIEKNWHLLMHVNLVT